MQQMEYVPGRQGTRRHRGQQKLLLSEIEFLTMYANKQSVVVYAGAADGYHIPLLTQLFPCVQAWFLWDPAPFAQNVLDACDGETFFVYNRPFTDAVAKHYAAATAGSNLLFICDIRREATDENSIREDMQLQLAWSRSMNAHASMLKFRLPYLHPDQPDTPVLYAAARIFLQVYAPKNSTECRCILDQNTPKELVEYSPRIHEERMCWFNNELREKQAYDEKAERMILRGYLEKNRGVIQVSTVEGMLALIDTYMSRRFRHGQRKRDRRA